MDAQCLQETLFVATCPTVQINLAWQVELIYWGHMYTASRSVYFYLNAPAQTIHSCLSRLIFVHFFIVN